MRIQHNIMAMTAYRNYTNNVSAMKKNLEKLSSGYKINRAGDDAAGLAISEKMRAQITGLETAQKNAKDGISLVQTAEGALTEVHDMLNRMVELATQSANGTYDNDTDRYQLQKEMDQLRAEIDRIADSSNFNGIQLLDGSMDAGGDVVYTSGTFEVPDNHAVAGSGTIQLPAKGTDLGTKTVLHSDAVTGSNINSFAIDLHNTTLAAGATLTIELDGGDKLTVENTGSAAMEAKDIVSTIADGKAKLNGNALSTLTGATLTGPKGSWDITTSGTRITFTQSASDTTDVDPDDIPDGVTVSATAGAGNGGNTSQGTQAEATYAATYTGMADTDWQDNDTITFAGGWKGTFKLVSGDWELQAGADTVTGFTPEFDGTNLTFTQDTAADLDTNPITAAITATVACAGKAGATASVGNAQWTDGVAASNNNTTTGGSTAMTGDYNVTTTVISTKRDAEAERLASTYFDLGDMENDAGEITEGSQITIGRDTYTFTTDKSKIGKDGYVVYNEGDSTATKAQLLTKAAENNGTYTVGTDGTGKITITEIPGQSNFDLTTMDGIEKSLGFKTATTNPVDSSKGLTLQIGPTAESFNQLKVNIKDCHVKALGIGNIDISTQDGAQEAVDAIKAAINYVSDVRGTLGATQNRLDHTINNLSVMTENIQDAESTIRDVDVAEEMMAYTKNNILIQSAQAMLAQANQVPQGVLQLLQ